MAELAGNTQKPVASANTPEASLSPAADPLPEPPAKKHHQTRAERLFFMTDVAINWLANSLISIGFTDFWQTKHFKKGSLSIGGLDFSYENCGDKSGRFFKKLLGYKETEQEVGRNFMDRFALTVPGWVIMPIMKVVRDHKLGIVQWGDKLIDKISAPSREELSHREEAYEAIKNEPKNTWGQALLGRVTGILLNWGVFDGFQKASEWLGQGNKLALQTNTKKLAQYSTDLLKGFDFVKNRTARVTQILDLTFVEMISCFLTATGFKVVMDKFQDLMSKRRDRKAMDEGQMVPAFAGGMKEDSLSSSRMREDAILYAADPQEPRHSKHSQRFTPTHEHVARASHATEPLAIGG